ncbi:MAG: PRC-barrel domain-containing protein [Bradyrhizobiaceae bacterium]|nr:PRC-barrel domain-containing protein [Bradyrhizobiaceae bacterium]
MPKRIALLATAAALAITPALAQQSTSPSPQQPAPQAQQPAQPSDMKAGAAEKFVSAQSTDEWMGSDVIGTRVRGGGDENIGTISDLLIDKDGNVKAVVIGVGGFLGIGQKNVAVSFDSLKLQRSSEGTQEARLSMSKAELEGAPDFKEYEPPRPAASRPGGSPGGSPGGTTKPGGL